MMILDINPIHSEIKLLNEKFDRLSSLVQTKSTQKINKIVDLEGLLVARPGLGSKSKIYKAVSSGEIPHRKTFGKLWFNLDEIDELIYPERKK